MITGGLARGTETTVSSVCFYFFIKFQWIGRYSEHFVWDGFRWITFNYLESADSDVDNNDKICFLLCITNSHRCHFSVAVQWCKSANSYENIVDIMLVAVLIFIITPRLRHTNEMIVLLGFLWMDIIWWWLWKKNDCGDVWKAHCLQKQDILDL